MFIVSQFLLHKLNITNVSTYSIAIGLALYAGIYLYILYYQNDYIFLFNKVLIYLIGLDLLLSAFYHFKLTGSITHNKIDTQPYIELAQLDDTDLTNLTVTSVESDDLDNSDKENTQVVQTIPKRGRGRPRKNPIHTTHSEIAIDNTVDIVENTVDTINVIENNNIVDNVTENESVLII